MYEYVARSQSFKKMAIKVKDFLFRPWNTIHKKSFHLRLTIVANKTWVFTEDIEDWIKAPPPVSHSQFQCCIKLLLQHLLSSSSKPSNLSAVSSLSKLHTDNMLGTLCTLITALTCKETDLLQLWPHVGFISLCVSLDSMSSCCFQVWVVWRWWHRSLLWRWGKERQSPWTVTWGLLLMLLAGINRFLEEFLSLYWCFITVIALQHMALVSLLPNSHLIISQHQIIDW